MDILIVLSTIITTITHTIHTITMIVMFATFAAVTSLVCCFYDDNQCYVWHATTNAVVLPIGRAPIKEADRSYLYVEKFALRG